MSMESIRNLGSGGPQLAKILAELQGLSLSVVTGATAGNAMAVTGIESEDTLAAAINLTDSSAADVGNMSIVDRRAQGTITCASTVEDGDTVVVNGKTYTFTDVVKTIAYNTPPYVVPFTYDPSGSDPEEIAANLATAIMSGDSNIHCVLEEDQSSPPLLAVVRVIWRVAGTVGNTKTLAQTGDHVTLSGNQLSGGTATSGITSSDNLSGKTLVLVWYNKQ